MNAFWLYIEVQGNELVGQCTLISIIINAISLLPDISILFINNVDTVFQINNYIILETFEFFKDILKFSSISGCDI